MKFDLARRTEAVLLLARSWHSMEIHCDLTVRCSLQSTKPFSCHKLILWDYLVKNVGVCPRDLENLDEVIIPDIEEDQFEEFIKFLYGYDMKLDKDNEWLLDLVSTPYEEVQVKLEAMEAPEEDEQERLMHQQGNFVICKEEPDFQEFETERKDIKQVLEAVKKSHKVKGTKVFKCQICPKEFGRHDHLNRHLLQHTGEKPFQCQLCFKGFTRKDKMKMHMLRTHRDVFSALGHQTADSNFMGQVPIQNLAEYHQAVSVTDLTPPLPGLPPPLIRVKEEPSAIEVKPDIPEEMESEEEEEEEDDNKNNVGLVPAVEAVPKKKDVPCKHCDEKFASLRKRKQHTLEAHMDKLKENGLLFTHNNAVSIKNHVCPEDGCIKYFRHSCELVDHINVVHKNEKNYICELCSKAFPYRKSLRLDARPAYARKVGSKVSGGVI